MEFIDLKTQYAPTQRIAQGLALAMPWYVQNDKPST
jgi:hypothetical protein